MHGSIRDMIDRKTWCSIVRQAPLLITALHGQKIISRARAQRNDFINDPMRQPGR